MSKRCKKLSLSTVNNKIIYRCQRHLQMSKMSKTDFNKTSTDVKQMSNKFKKFILYIYRCQTDVDICREYKDAKTDFKQMSNRCNKFHFSTEISSRWINYFVITYVYISSLLFSLENICRFVAILKLTIVNIQKLTIVNIQKLTIVHNNLK